MSMPVTCKCGNVRVRCVPSQEAVVEEKHGDASFKGPYSLALGGVTFEVSSLVHEDSSGVTGCLNCDMLVFFENPKQGFFVSDACLNAPPESASQVYGLVVSQVDVGGGVTSNVKLDRLFDSFSLRLRDETEQKIRHFAEKCNLDTQMQIDEAARDLRLIGAKIHSVAKKDSFAEGFDENNHSISPKKSLWASSSKFASSEMTGISKLGANRNLAKKKSADSILLNFTKQSGGNMTGNVTGGSSMWALDEELEELKSEEKMDEKKTIWGSEKLTDLNDSIEEMNLNVSAETGLLPGAKKLLYGSNEKSISPKRRLIVAQSVPVSVPTFGRRSELRESSNGSDLHNSMENSMEESSGVEQLTANTFQEQIRLEWLAQTRISAKNDDDRDFLLVAGTKNDRQALRVNKNAI